MLIFLDIETTGFDGEKDSLLEIAAISWDGTQEISRFSCLISQPIGGSIPPMITSLTGITDQMCEDDGIPLETALQKLQDFISPEDIIVGHNISFDIGFLQKKGMSIPNKSIDTFLLSVLILGRKENSHSLEILAQKYGIRQEDAHRAMSDTQANLQFYIFLQTKWKQQNNEDLKKLLIEKKDALDLSELSFFFEDSTIDFANTAPEIQNLDPFLDLSSHSVSSYEEWISTPNAVWMKEVSFAEGELIAIIESVVSQKKQICIAYSDEEREMSLELYESLQGYFPSLQYTFVGNISQQIDETLWKKFLQKSSYTRAESIVLLKIFCAKQENAQEYLRFMGEEWTVARSLFSPHFTPEEYTSDILFIPFSQTYHIPDSYKIVVLRGENLENLLEEKEKKKLFEKRIAEDFPAFDFTPFETIAHTLRSWKGDNKYAIPVYEHEFFHDQTIQSALRNIENQCRSDDTFATQEWKSFFDLKAENTHIFCIELLSDNALAFSLTPKYLQESFDELMSCGDGVLILGRAFVKNKANQLHYTFNIPSTVQFYPNTAPFPPLSTDFSWEQLENALLNSPMVVVSVSSKKAGEDIVEKMRNFCEENNVFIAAQRGGSVKKIRTQMMSYSSVLVVGVSSFLDALRLEHKNIGLLYIPKLSFDPQNHTILKYRREFFQNDFEDFALPRATQRLHKEIRRFPQVPMVIVGDEKLKQNWAKSMISW